MTVEEMRVGDSSDRFPVGMRVLAVDDDPTCLKLLETLLRRCQYKVTTTSQAKTALKMLRENKNRFDLVISDVHMPDMDGFKLLELVGLEMDLPVIMLSASSDTSLVMKGITHGACDYLVKPIRLEELKNIWQHVIRKNKSNSMHQTKSIHPGLKQKLNRKRKEEEEEEENQGHENDNDDSTALKKPRVVWSIELHGKFVSAVKHLGIKKAVPKSILDLMKVQGLTRENVASHLQKYRLYLKRISSVTNQQQGNMVGALGSYMHTNSPSLMSPSLSSSLSPGRMFGRLNSPVGINLHHHRRNYHFNHPNNPLMMNTTHSVTDTGKFQPTHNSTYLEQNKFAVDGQTSFYNRFNLQNSRIPQTGMMDSKPLKGVDGSFLDHGTFQISNTLPNHLTASKAYDQQVYSEGMKLPVYSQCQVANQIWGQNEADQSSKNTNHHIVSRDEFDNNYNSLIVVPQQIQEVKSDQDLLIFEQMKHVRVYDDLEDIMTAVIKQDGSELMEFQLGSYPFNSSL